MGVLFDVIKLLRAYAPKNKVITAIFDILFWFIAICALFAFTLTVSGGRMRWYVLLGVASGGFVYNASLSEIVFKVMRGAVSALRKLLGLITRPIYLLLRLIWRTGKKTARSTEDKARKKIRAARMQKRKVDNNGGKKKKKTQGTVS